MNETVLAGNTVEEGKLCTSVGVFWDIENCKLTPNHSVKKFVDFIEDIFLPHETVEETIIVIACNLHKIPDYVATELFDLGCDVRIIHHGIGDANEADDRLINEIEEFAEYSDSPPLLTKLVVISGDGDFAKSLEEFRTRNFKIHVVYPKEFGSKKLLKVAHTHQEFEALLECCLNGIPSKSNRV